MVGLLIAMALKLVDFVKKDRGLCGVAADQGLGARQVTGELVLRMAEIGQVTAEIESILGDR